LNGIDVWVKKNERKGTVDELFSCHVKGIMGQEIIQAIGIK
jgi:hypothetical protein